MESHSECSQSLYGPGILCGMTKQLCRFPEVVLNPAAPSRGKRGYQSLLNIARLDWTPVAFESSHSHLLSMNHNIDMSI
eukprot:4265216-Pleurochrysis_carterae.AAC.1